MGPSILSVEGRLQIGISDSSQVWKVVSCIISKDRGFSLKYSTEHQNFRIWLRKFRAYPFLLSCLSFILPFSTHSILKLERYLLRFRIISATLLLSPQNFGLVTKTLQSGRDFNIADFNRKMPSTIFLESLVIASFILTWKIKDSVFFLDNWLNKLTYVSNSSSGEMENLNCFMTEVPII